MTPLRQRMIEDMQLPGLSPHTQRAYIQALRLLARYYVPFTQIGAGIDRDQIHLLHILADRFPIQGHALATQAGGYAPRPIS